MSFHVIATLKIVILEALVGLLLASYFFEKGASRRARWGLTAAFGLVAALSVLAYCNFGSFHDYRVVKSQRVVHRHEQFHFYFGSAYLEQLRYDGIYAATALAATEDRREIRNWKLRDPLTFRSYSATRMLAAGREVKARFDEESWEAFKADQRFFFNQLKMNPVALNDRGNTGSPAWALVASVVTRTLGTGFLAVNLYALIDPLLLLTLFAAIWRCFGARVACIAIAVGLLPPMAYDYLGGSLLRLDWLFALGMAACCVKVDRYKTAGVFLGYAVASKIFCGLVALALGLAFAIDLVRSRRLQRGHLELVLVAIGTLGATVALSALFFGGFDIWGDFWQRALTSHHKTAYYFTDQGFQTIFLQAVHPGTAVLDWTPTRIAASIGHVQIGNYPISFLLVRLMIAAAFVFVLARHETIFAFGIGVLFVFIGLVTHMYYWQMLMLLALVCADRYREDPRKLLYLLFLCVFLMAEYVFVQFDALKEWQGYFASYWLTMFCLFIFAVEIASSGPARRLLERSGFSAE